MEKFQVNKYRLSIDEDKNIPDLGITLYQNNEMKVSISKYIKR